MYHNKRYTMKLCKGNYLIKGCLDKTNYRASSKGQNYADICEDIFMEMCVIDLFYEQK